MKTKLRVRDAKDFLKVVGPTFNGFPSVKAILKKRVTMWERKE